MSYYTYYDRDYFTNSGNFPLSGHHYRTLLECCFRYAAYVSFLKMEPTHPFFERLEKWKVQPCEITIDHAVNMHGRCLYAASEGLHQEMLSWTDNLFSLYTLEDYQYPEDPVFIRSDSSVFFDSIIHEGECSIYPNADECIEDVLSCGRWLYINDSGQPQVAAREHQFPLPTLAEVQENQLYKELLLVRDDPLRYLPDMSADAICVYVDRYRPSFLKKLDKLMPGWSCVPKWYFAFEMYVLGECDALTSTKIPEAFEKKGITGKTGFQKYFSLLSQYMELIKAAGTAAP